LQYACGERPKKLATDTRFSRREQARRLFDAIEARLPRDVSSRSDGGVRLSPAITP
jgi:hypothetical protein